MAKDQDKLIADQAKEISALKKQLARQREQEAEAQGEVIDYTKDLIELDKQRLDYLREIQSVNEILVDAEKQIRKASGDVNKTKRKQLRDIRDEAKEAIKLARAKESELANEKKMLAEKQKQAKIAKEILDIQNKYSDEIESGLGFLDNISDTIKEIPIVGGILSKALGVDELKEKVSKELSNTFASTLQGATSNAGSLKDMLIGGFKGAAAGAQGLMAALGPLLPIAIAIGAAVLAIKKGFEFDQEITDLAKGLGISKEEAKGIHSELKDIASTTQVVGANTEELSKAYAELAKGLGSAQLATAELAETQVLLTKQYGLAGDEALEFQKVAMVSGKTAEQNVVAIQGITNEMTGGMMNYRDVMKDVAGTSKAVQATFKGNIGQLTKAVITARKFGKTLDEVKKITDGLLDIEGSIEKEMQARVLTGKEINLDQARALKLRGDEAGAMEEVMKQVGSYDEFMKMAPYQQEALADATGMTVEELVKSAEQQKLFNDLSIQTGKAIKSAADLSNADLATLQGKTAEQAKALVLADQQVAAQEKLSQLGTKVSAIFGKIAEPLMEIIDPLMEMVDFILPAIGPLLKFVFAPILGVIDVVKGIIKLFKGDFMGGLKDLGKGIIELFYSPFKLVYDLIDSFFGSGDKAKEASNTPVKKQNDAMIGSDGGLVVSGARGTYQLAADDTVIAGTNLGASTTAASPSTATSAGTGTDLTELVGLMKELVASVKQPAVIKIGNKVVNEIDRVQSMNRSYVGKVDNSYGAV
jgi:hypothetical protein